MGAAFAPQRTAFIAMFAFAAPATLDCGGVGHAVPGREEEETTMRTSPWWAGSHVLLAVLAFALCAPVASAQIGDPARGKTLYRDTYKCTDCHAVNPGPNIDTVLAGGVTSGGILDSIRDESQMTVRYASTLAQNATDVADIAAYLASVMKPGVPDLNQHGLTGSWFKPATSGQGVEVEIFPDLSSPGHGYTQVSWFTYDATAGGADHQRWYTASGPVVTGPASATLTIYQNASGNFDALPVTAATAVGTAVLSFDTCTSGRFSYAFTDGSGRAGSIPLTRLTQNMTCSTTSARPTDADFAFSGNWLDPATSGQGVTLEVNPASSTAFVAWYTYAPNAAGTGPSGERWYTGQGAFAAGARAIPLTFYQTTGGMFDTPTPPGQTSVVVGTGTLTFQSCTSATLAFTFTGGSSSGASGSIALSRIGPTPPGCS